MTRLAQLLSLKSGEGRMSSFMIGIMPFTAVGAALGGTGIEALFFARFGVDYLPYMYLGLGLTSMITSFIVTAALGRIPKRIVYTAIPIFIALTLIGARLALLTRLLWLYPVLWLGKEVLNALVSLMIWGIAGVVCDTRQAKRLFPLFNASFILGQVIGGSAIGFLVGITGAENLLMVWAGSLIIAFLFSRAVLSHHQIESAPPRKSRRRQPTLAQEMQRGFQYVRTSPLLVSVSLSTIFFSILYFSIALPFSRIVTAQFPDENALASFLGIFNGLSTAAAFLTSLFLANRLFARFGIMASLIIFPIIYIIGFGTLIFAPAFFIVIGFRFIQMVLLSGIADPAWQTMFNVVPNEKRDQVRAFVGGVPEQAGVFIAGGILVIGEQALVPGQLYIIGFIAALSCTYLILKAWRGYNLALVDALRAGRPQLFFTEEQPFGGFRQDAAAIQTALRSLRDPDPALRRISAEIVGHLSLPESTNALIAGLSDVDPLVRLASLKALSHSNATPALLDIAASLSDPEPDVRSQAVTTLTVLAPDSPALTKLLTPLLDDESTKVSTRAAVSILRSSTSHSTQAKQHLRAVAVLGNLEERAHAIDALGEWGDREAFDFLANELRERQLDPNIKRALLTSLTKINSPESISYLCDSLKDPYSRATSARLLGNVGESVTDSILKFLNDEAFTEGALLALEHLPPPPSKPILEFARLAVSCSSGYDALRRNVQAAAGNARADNRREGRSEAMHLLEESLHEKSHQHGIRALRAIGLLGSRDSMNLAIENLKTGDETQRANVIEALDSISSKYRDIIQPLTKLWEDESTQQGADIKWERLLGDADEWIRECAVFARHYGENMDTLATLSLMDRILFFRRVPLFANLSPVDLKQVAAMAEEEVFSDGEELCHEGEVGDVMFIIISGEVRVCSDKDGHEMEIARRQAGDYVGEMSIIGREPRMASLVAVGDVRTLCIDQKSFEGLIRERPDVSLAVMKVLSQRLKEASLKK
jgi:HEAT repeat protein